MDDIEIRESRPDDAAALTDLYSAAFAGENLLPLVNELLQSAPAVLSLVAIGDGACVGHVVFTTCGLDASRAKVALLGPLAVAPERQRRGIGSALVRAGFDRMEAAGVAAVYVLGDPAYYRRQGFRPETEVTPPYPLPADWRGAWQSIGLCDTTPPGRSKIAVPPPWRNRSLWTP